MTFTAALPKLTEKRFQGQVVRLAELCGWRCYHTFDSRRSAAGFPDAVFVRRPRVLFVEFKSDRGRITDQQKAWIDELRACGQEAYVLRPSNWSAAEKLLR